MSSTSRIMAWSLRTRRRVGWTVTPVSPCSLAGGWALLGLVAENAAEGVEGGVGELVEVQGVKVVHIVAAEKEDQGPHHQPVCVEHVVTEGCEVGAFFGHAPCQVDKVVNGVLCGHVVCLHGRVVPRRCRLASRSMRGRATVWHGQSAGALNAPTTLPSRIRPARLAAVRRTSTGWGVAAGFADLLDVLSVPAIGSFAPPRARPHLAHHVEAVGEVVGDAVYVG